MVANMTKHFSIKKQMIGLSLVVLLVGCSNPFSEAMDYGITGGRHMLMTAEPAFLDGLPDGDDSFSQGFRDGCNTTLGIVSFTGVRGLDFAYDVNRGIEDREYYRGYRLGSDYCVYYVDPEPL